MTDSVQVIPYLCQPEHQDTPMETQLLYYTYPDQYSCDTQILFCSEDEGGKFFIPQETIFYFGGGGQPADEGALRTADGQTFPILKVVPQENSFKHYFQNISGSISLDPGTPVQMEISEQVRHLHSRIHTAGHLVSSVVTETLGIPLLPLKGYHYPDSPYVEFANPQGLQDMDPDPINHSLQENISKDLPVTSFLQVGDKQPLDSFLPPGFQLTSTKTLRWVGIHSFLFYPCAGTHVRATGVLGKVSIKYIKSKKGNLRMAYQLEPQ
ncbi:MAG: alanyl-tRNA editing protein [Chitinophagaceae bacterium]